MRNSLPSTASTTGTHSLYREETLGGAMLRAIRQTEEEYAGMQQALLQLGRDIDRESRSNLERALAACSPSEPQQARP